MDSLSTMNSQNFPPESWDLLGCIDLNNYNWSSNKVENDDFLTDLHRAAEILQEKVGQDSDISTPTPSPTQAVVPDMYGYPSPPPLMNIMEADAPPQYQRIKNENPNSSPNSLYFDNLSPPDGSFFKNEPIQKDYCVPSPNDEVPNGSPHSFYYDISSPQNGGFYKAQQEDAKPNGSPNPACYDYETLMVQDGGLFKNDNVPSPQFAMRSEDSPFFKSEIVSHLCDETPGGSPNSLYYESLSPQDGSFFKNEIAKPRMKDECLVSLLSAPAKPMTNTINDNIISQLGHANSDNTKGGLNRVMRTFDSSAIKTEVIDTQYVDIKQEENSFQADLQFDMASSSCQLPSDLCTFAFQNVCADIQATCRKLQISEDPTKWSVENVQLWIMKILKDYNHLPIPSEHFQLNGMQLCEMNLQQFCQKTPHSGNLLFSQMEIWKTTCRQQQFSRAQSFANQTPQMPVDNFTHWPSSTTFPGSPDSASSDTNMTDVEMRLNTERHSPVQPAGSPSFNVEGHEDTSSDDEEAAEKANSPNPTGKKPGSSHSQIHLYEFLWNLLNQPRLYGSYIRWIDRNKGIFKIEDSAKVANLWGIRKNRPAMNYDKMSRSIRQYYRKEIMKKTAKSQRLVYQFCLDKLQDKNGEIAKKARKAPDSCLSVM